MHFRPRLHVLTQDLRLGRALLDQCRRVEGIQIGGIRTVQGYVPERASLVVTPAPELPAPMCKEITLAGVRVIVLAPVPRDSDRLSYIGAGAHAYLPMDPRGSTLVTAVQEAGDALRTLACGIRNRCG